MNADGRRSVFLDSIIDGELRYVYLRDDKPGFEIVWAAIESEPNINTVPVNISLAVHAAELRRKYYSKQNAFSYNDGLYLAVGIAEQTDFLITTDPHLLGVREIETMLPSRFR
jgi:hypothetical protein